MTRIDKAKFIDFLHTVATYYDKKLSDEVVNIYYEDLKYAALQDLQNAFAEHRKKSTRGKYFPKTCDILELLPGKKQEINPDICKFRTQSQRCIQQARYGGFCEKHCLMMAYEYEKVHYPQRAEITKIAIESMEMSKKHPSEQAKSFVGNEIYQKLYQPIG